eukprot:TRINITY_DN3021_c0_g1_i4.p1 TRINITY_DN3021_c0_g1~~TRINITY_DN3021_c0_g1_i4.p1  ORF type:complete len:126 (+),score=23.50 TRINITY_DN3021_c0_g1_i4:856-1233(+)
MWIDPGEVVIKFWWSYYQNGVEEVVYRSYYNTPFPPSTISPSPTKPQQYTTVPSSHPPSLSKVFHSQPYTPALTPSRNSPPASIPISPLPLSTQHHQQMLSASSCSYIQMYPSWSPKSPGFTLTA